MVRSKPEVGITIGEGREKNDWQETKKLCGLDQAGVEKLV